MKKLLYITTNIGNSGGVSRLLSAKLNYLLDIYAYEIEVLNTFGDFSPTFYPFNKTIKFHNLPRKRNKIADYIGYKKSLNKYINCIDPDIIINTDNGLKSAFFPIFYEGKVPLILENHISRDIKSDTFLGNFKLKIGSLFFRQFIKKYKKIIVYNYSKNEWNSNNIKIIENPLPFKRKLIKMEPTKSKVAIAIGRIVYQKGYDKLLQIWKLVYEKHPDWELHIYGAGNVLELTQLVHDYHLENSVHFFKPIKDLTNVYLNASMLLNTSRYEPFGLAIIEGMSFGLPVLAFSNTLGPKSYINNNENGYLIKENDIKIFAKKIIYLIENQQERERIGMEAAKSVDRFNIDNVMKKWHDLFQTIS